MTDVPWSDRDTRSLTKFAENLKGHGYVRIVSVVPVAHLFRHNILVITLGGHKSPGWQTRYILLRQIESLMARHTDWEPRVGCWHIHRDGRTCSVKLIWEAPCTNGK